MNDYRTIRDILSTAEYSNLRVVRGERVSTPAEAKAALDRIEQREKRLREALEQIAGMPTSERNPGGDEQAAHSMQLVAQDALEEQP